MPPSPDQPDLFPVVVGLNCLQVPFGTVLGSFTLIVLLRGIVRER